VPADIVQALNLGVRQAFDAADVRERLRHEGIVPNRLDAKEFAAFVAFELKRWEPVVKASGAKND
jgi:tripartite-type tricarboxylate transporter receptor subunit TctC